MKRVSIFLPVGFLKKFWSKNFLIRCVCSSNLQYVSDSWRIWPKKYRFRSSLVWVIHDLSLCLNSNIFHDSSKVFVPFSIFCLTWFCCDSDRSSNQCLSHFYTIGIDRKLKFFEIHSNGTVTEKNSVWKSQIVYRLIVERGVNWRSIFVSVDEVSLVMNTVGAVGTVSDLFKNQSQKNKRKLRKAEGRWKSNSLKY
jgi:hypothetical protein